MANEYVGSIISLISKSDIKYQGILHSIDPVAATVSLEKVRSLGTEGRKSNPAEEIPPSDNVYDFIVFRASDVKDLQIEAPVATPADTPALSNDPAIVATQPSTSSPPAPAQLPGQGPPPTQQQQMQMQQQQYRGQFPPQQQYGQYGQYPPYQQQQYGQYPPYQHYGQQGHAFGPPGYGPPMYPGQQFQGYGPPPPPPGLPSPAMAPAEAPSPAVAAQTTPAAPVEPTPVVAPLPTPAPAAAPAPAPSQPQVPARPATLPAPVVQAPAPAVAPPAVPVKPRSYANPGPPIVAAVPVAAVPVAAPRPAVAAPRPAVAAPEVLGKKDVQDVEQLVKDMSSLSARSANGAQNVVRGGRRDVNGAGVGGSVFGLANGANPARRAPAGQPGGGRKLQPFGAPPVATLPVPTSDFDFLQSNAKFTKDAPTEADEEVFIPAAPVEFYNKSTSFFDNVSSDVKERNEMLRGEFQDPPAQRFDRGAERSKNMDTFGEAGGNTNGMRRGRGRGRGGYGRGGPAPARAA